jgi:hypothetical protein
MNKVNNVPGKPKIKAITFQNELPVPWAGIAVKLRLAKIQTADTPQSVRDASDHVSDCLLTNASLCKYEGIQT